MTPLPHNPAITVIDLPEDVKDVRTWPIDEETPPFLDFYTSTNEDGYDYVPLPPGTYKLICLGLQATEEEAREIVQAVDGGYLKYGSLKPLMERLANMGNPWYSDYSYYKNAAASLRSLITSNGWKNPAFLRKEK